MTNVLNEKIGLLREATIVDYDPVLDTIEIQLNTAQAAKGKTRISIPAPAPHAMFYNNGLFIGTAPQIGTPIIVGQGNGGQYFFVAFKAENLSSIPDLKLGELLIRSSDDAKITLNTSNQIAIGSDNNRIFIDNGSSNKPETNLISFNFKNENHFTQAYREVGGLIKRDLKPNISGYDQNTKLEDDSYDHNYKLIGLDRTSTPNDIITGSSKNPPLVERRELIYEFQYNSEVMDDATEALQYGNSKQPTTNYISPNRRKSRSDVLSLTLLEPNYLMETIKGTVVDIFGNILDLNRMPLPVGKDQNTIRSEVSKDKQLSFLQIKELERKSLAYHFEINARKDFNQKTGKSVSTLELLDIKSNSDNSRLRSRFFIDIDKEGQFKINVPASSEKGNIPLLTRYENRSTYDPQDNNNPNKLLFDPNNLDIFLDSFAAPTTSFADTGFLFSKEKGSILLKDNKGEVAPIDRITQAHIKHGTAHHDILKTCFACQDNIYLEYQTKSNLTPIDIDAITLLKNVVSDTIIVSGDSTDTKGGPNAGGRSGQINMDGSIEFNIGANTIDRQSLWADLAGGVVANIGRDKQFNSAVIGMDGNLIMQIGGFGISGDSRFVKENNGPIGAILDLRIFGAGGYVHMIRCDDSGITVMTPGNMQLHSKGSMKITSDTDIAIECETLTIQGRMLLKEFGGSI